MLGQAIRELRRHGVRSALTAAGIAIGVTALVLLGALSEKTSRLVEGGRDFGAGQITVSGAGGDAATGMTRGALVSGEQLTALRAVPGVAEVAPIVMFPLTDSPALPFTLAPMAFGVDAELLALNRRSPPPRIRRGRADPAAREHRGGDRRPGGEAVRGRRRIDDPGARPGLPGGRGPRADAHRSRQLRHDVLRHGVAAAARQPSRCCAGSRWSRAPASSRSRRPPPCSGGTARIPSSWRSGSAIGSPACRWCRPHRRRPSSTVRSGFLRGVINGGGLVALARRLAGRRQHDVHRHGGATARDRTVARGGRHPTPARRPAACSRRCCWG